MKRLAMVLVGSLMFLGVSIGASKDKTYTGEIMDSQCAKNGSHEMMFKKEGINDPKMCTVNCVKMGGKYVLFDGSTKTVYELDDQTKPEQFAGQKVKVTGALDKASKTIHVTNIKPAS